MVDKLFTEIADQKDIDKDTVEYFVTKMAVTLIAENETERTFSQLSKIANEVLDKLADGKQLKDVLSGYSDYLDHVKKELVRVIDYVPVDTLRDREFGPRRRRAYPTPSQVRNRRNRRF